jgi:hypothetical protein
LLAFFGQSVKLQTMAQLKIHGRNLPAQRDTSRYLSEQTGVAVIYLGIIVTFAAFSLIACVIWLLVW